MSSSYGSLCSCWVRGDDLWIFVFVVYIYILVHQFLEMGWEGIIFVEVGCDFGACIAEQLGDVSYLIFYMRVPSPLVLISIECHI